MRSSSITPALRSRESTLCRNSSSARLRIHIGHRDPHARLRPPAAPHDRVDVGQDQRVADEWLDANGGVLRREARHVGHGTRYVAFSSGRVSASGNYKAIVVIDGRRVSELPFAVL